MSRGFWELLLLLFNSAVRPAETGERSCRGDFPDESLGCVQGKGLVAGIQVVRPGAKTPDPDTALKINVACFQRGLLMFAPVGAGGECLKIAPPLTISEDALRESILVLEEALDEVLGTA